MAGDSSTTQLDGSAAPQGSIYTPIYTERRVRLYSVTDAEFSQLSLFNSGTVFFFSVGGTLLGFTGNGLFSVISEAPLQRGIVSYTIGFGVGAVVFFLVGIVLLKMRRSLAAEIKARSTEIAK